MKSTTAFAAVIAIAFAAASTSAAFAQSNAPGGAPRKPNRVTAVPPPPPPPGGPDKYATQTQPPGPGSGAPAGPKPVDDFAPDPNTKPATCHAALGIAYGICVASLVTLCVENSGQFSCTDDSCTCKRPPQN